MNHSDEVTSICLSSNQEVLYSCSYDKRVVAWHTKLWNSIFEVKFAHPLYTLRLTNDNEMLVAISKQGQLSTLVLEENPDAIRLNFPKHIYKSSIVLYVTKDNNFIFIEDKSQQILEVWNLESKMMAFTLKSECVDIGLATSSDSRFLFYTSDTNEILQYNLRKN